MKYFFLFFLLLISHELLAQRNNADRFIFNMYSVKYAEMMRSRGVPFDDFSKLLGEYTAANLKSNQDFATLLRKIYPDNTGIGIIFYYYDKNILYRTFFKPGKVIEEKKITISAEELTQLSVDLQQALNIEKSMANRSPKKRGVEVKNINRNDKKLNLAGITKTLGKILLPESLDKSYKQLIVIPALNIGTFPFHILKPYQDNSYLIDHCSFTISPGIIDLIAVRTRMLRSNGGDWKNGVFYDKKGNEDRNQDSVLPQKLILKNALLVGNPTYPTNLEYDFPDLPGAKKEVEGAIKYAGKYKFFNGATAKKDSIIKYWGNNDLIYFATHGIADFENPMEQSYLVLSGKEPKLTTRNIMDLAITGKKFPNLVILSACQSGLGKSMDVGVTGLARSFIIAGSRNVVMSLWNVDDQATAFLMNRFLFHLQQERNFMPSEQLRLAMIDTKKKYPNPIHWASFSVFGLSY